MKINHDDIGMMNDLLRELVARLDGPVLLVTFGPSGEWTQVHAALPTPFKAELFAQAIEAITETANGDLELLCAETIEKKPRLQ